MALLPPAVEPLILFVCDVFHFGPVSETETLRLLDCTSDEEDLLVVFIWIIRSSSVSTQ